MRPCSQQAADAAVAARDHGRATVQTQRLSSSDFSPPRPSSSAPNDCGRRLARAGPPGGRGRRAPRRCSPAAARDRQAIDKLKERQKAEHDAEWARKSQNTLDELALAVHRRGGALPHEYRSRDQPCRPAAGDDGAGARAGADAGDADQPTSFSTALAERDRPRTRPRDPRRRAATAATASATSTSSSLPAGTPYAAEITAAATANGIDPALLAGLVKQESGFNPNAGSGAGARGLTQLMPGTAAGLGVSNVLDPVQSLNGGAKYLKQQLDAFGGDVTKALAAYNAGPGAVQRFGGVPPYAETQNYVRIVQANAAAYRAGTTRLRPPPPPAPPARSPPRSRGP